MGKFEKLQICLWLGLELMAGQNMLNFVVKHLLEGCVTKTRGQWPHRRAGNMGHYCKQSTLIVPRERLSCKILTPIPLQPSISSRWSYPALEYLGYQSSGIHMAYALCFFTKCSCSPPPPPHPQTASERSPGERALRRSPLAKMDLYSYERRSYFKSDLAAPR